MLGTTRQQGMALGPIPWDAIIAYADWSGLSRENSHLLVMVINAMDAAFLKWNQKTKPNG